MKSILVKIYKHSIFSIIIKMKTKEGYEKALEVIKKNCCVHGFYASYIKKSNYKRIWSRDGVLQGLAGIMAEDKKIIQTLRRNLETLKKYQDETGRIASNVDVEKDDVSYGRLVGKVDASMWYVIGVGQYFKYSKDKKFLKEFFKSVEKTINYLKCVELNGKGFLYIPNGGDWADEYITHGYVLFDQLLYYQALKEYLNMLKKLNLSYPKIDKKIKNLKEMIEVNYFPSKNKKNKKAVYNKGLYEKILNGFDEEFALMYFSSDGFAPYLDSFANSILLITDIPSKNERKSIIGELNKRLNSQKMKVLPAFWPPITSFHHFWRNLKMNSLFKFENKPYHYHNGGLWPLIQGFFIASLVKQGKKKMAEKYLKEFSEAIQKDNYEFHEYFNGKNYNPGGIKNSGFSAAGYIIGYASVIKNKTIFN